MKFVMTATAVCAAALIGIGAILGAADISAKESSSSWNSTAQSNTSYSYVSSRSTSSIDSNGGLSSSEAEEIKVIPGKIERINIVQGKRFETAFFIMCNGRTITSHETIIKDQDSLPFNIKIGEALCSASGSYNATTGFSSVSSGVKIGATITVNKDTVPGDYEIKLKYTLLEDSNGDNLLQYYHESDELCVICPVTVWEGIESRPSGTCGENLNWKLDTDGTLTISGTGELTQSPFNVYKGDIHSVVIEEGVTSIGDNMFINYYGLTSVTIPDSVTNIGALAFYGSPWFKAKRAEEPLVVLKGILIDGTTSEEDVTIPNDVLCIGKKSFNMCSSLTSVTIPESVTSIRENAFLSCGNLKSVTIMNPKCEIADSDKTICNIIGWKDDKGETGFYTGTICGYEGSTAQAYAEKYGYTFESLGAAPGAEPTAEQALGDVNGDTIVNASDAATVLIASAAAGAGGELGLTEAQIKAADVNGDTTVNASDAAIILIYSAAVGAGQENVQITDFVH